MNILMQEKKEKGVFSCLDLIENVVRKMVQVRKDTWNLMLDQQNLGKLKIYYKTAIWGEFYLESFEIYAYLFEIIWNICLYIYNLTVKKSQVIIRPRLQSSTIDFINHNRPCLNTVSQILKILFRVWNIEWNKVLEGMIMKTVLVKSEPFSQSRNFGNYKRGIGMKSRNCACHRNFRWSLKMQFIANLK